MIQSGLQNVEFIAVRRFTAAAAGVISALFCGGQAFSQQIFQDGPSNVAGKRAQPEYDALGINVGGTRLYPSLAFAAQYDSNVFFSAGNETGDESYSVTPSLRAQTEFGRNQFDFDAKAAIKRYFDLKSQNRENYDATARMTGVIDKDTGYNVTVSYENREADRGTVENELTFGDPVNLSGFAVGAGVARQFGRLRGLARASVDTDNYKSIQTAGGVIDQDFRDRVAYQGQLDFGYDLTSDFALFTNGRIMRFAYSDENPLTNRDSTLVSTIFGVRYNITDLISSEVGAGYRTNDFENENFTDFSGLALLANISWHPTPLLSVNADVNQSTTTSAFDQVEAVTVTSASVSADYEVLRNLLASASVEAAQEKYENLGDAADRYAVRVGVTYKLNRMTAFKLQANYRHRESLVGVSSLGEAQGYGLGAYILLGL